MTTIPRVVSRSRRGGHILRWPDGTFEAWHPQGGLIPWRPTEFGDQPEIRFWGIVARGTDIEVVKAAMVAWMDEHVPDC